jgi:hypothetical protein
MKGYMTYQGVDHQIRKGNLKENGYIVLLPHLLKRKIDNRRWRLSLIVDAPEGVKMLTENDIQERFNENRMIKRAIYERSSKPDRP